MSQIEAGLPGLMGKSSYRHLACAVFVTAAGMGMPPGRWR